MGAALTNRLLQKTTLIVLCIILLMLDARAMAEPSAGPKATASFTAEMQRLLDGAEQALLALQPFPDEAAAGFFKNGRSLPKGYLEGIADRILEQRGKFAMAAELTRTALAYGAAGGNMNNIAGIDLYPLLMNHAGIDSEGAAVAAAAYMTTNNSAFNTYERTDRYPDMILYQLLKTQLADGSWPAAGQSTGDPASTARVLTALGPVAGSELTEEPVRKAVQWLRDKQQPNGGFDGKTGTTAQVITGLSSLGLDAAEFAQAGGTSLLDHLLAAKLADGSFSQAAGGGSDRTATVNAYLALTSYKLLSKQEGLLYSGLHHAGPVLAAIQIEGPGGTLAGGRIAGGDAVKAAAAFLQSRGLAYKLNADTAKPAFTAIEGIQNGRYSGRGEWKLAVYSGGSSWLYPENISSRLTVGDGDQLLVYYADDTELPDRIAVEWKDQYGQQNTGGSAYAGLPFSLRVTRSNRSLGGLPAFGVTVTLQGKSVVADSAGKVSFAGMKPGVYPVQVTKYRKDGAPALAKRTFALHIASPDLARFTDSAKVSAWARNDISVALSSGYIQGVSAGGNVLAPKQKLTRAEFLTLLMRLMHEFPDGKAASGFKDVPAGKWYSGTVAKAAELGIISSSSGRFEPDRGITREEAAVMVVQAAQLSTYGSTERMKLADVAGLPAASRQAVQAVYEHEIMTGSSGRFEPEQVLVREQAAAVLVRLQQLIPAASYQ
ncbi:S-layer homology domain-containing protein [Paenibacillus sp. MMS20-IR301]|uniref:S-layer homology domain-containing protein n=1 Tax=Paenibacillus sp. MMS20-IR301 TaxID=2895946 RepID=UPI0028E5BFC8|nr:S-layer homology domain-containing protein [Paenibacillus sp. MMS20-IR301]WNS43950.1 S-layer homology domain-containing protein [Paenibacillus sp. MMS20-IR301]